MTKKRMNEMPGEVGRLSNKPITLFLMTERGYEFLKETSKKYKSLYSLVVVGKDGSLQKDFEDEIISLCQREGIAYIKRADFSGVKSEYAMAIAWRWLIKHPSEKLIVFHDSPLPKYRGFSPLVNALINGETEIGVSAIFGGDEFDTGDIIAQYTSIIAYPIQISRAIQINNKNYIRCAEFILEKLLKDQPVKGRKQTEEEASYSVWRDAQDYAVDWSKSANEICRFIDAVGFPYEGASTTFDGKLVRILAAEVTTDVIVENRHAGKVLFVRDGKPTVICGKGMIKLLEAYIEESGGRISLFPLPKFRIRFN